MNRILIERMQSKKAVSKKAAGLIAVLVFPFVLLSCGKSEKAPALVPEVTVVPVVQEDVPVYSEWIATLDGYVNAQIRAQVQGYLIKQNYSEGLFIKKGDLLFELDARSFQAVLEQAKGDLAEAQAQFEKTELDVKRYRPLAAESAISQQELDDAVQANLAAKAKVDAVRASVDQARVNLDFTKITSPIDGIAGIAKAQIGDLVGPQSGVLTTVSTLDPVKAYFPISEQEYLSAAQKIREMEAQTGPRRRAGLELILADGSVFPEKGSFIIADRQVDPNTGTMQIAASFPNPGNFLRPGQYAKVRAVTSHKRGALLVPQRAVSELQGSFQVAVVDAAGIVDIRNVKPAERAGTRWVIDAGLQPNDRVVVEGLQKVRDGMKVKPLPEPAEGSPSV